MRAAAGILLILLLLPLRLPPDPLPGAVYLLRIVGVHTTPSLWERVEKVVVSVVAARWGRMVQLSLAFVLSELLATKG